MVAAFVHGAREGGLLTTVKHFPGHGDTAVDSHLQLATITGDRARLETVELLPFRRAIEAGVDAVMLGHIAVAGARSHGRARHALQAGHHRPAARRARLPRAGGHRRDGHGGRASGLDGRGGGARRAGRRRHDPAAARSAGGDPGPRARAVREGQILRVAARRVGAADPGAEGAAGPATGAHRRHRAAWRTKSGGPRTSSRRSEIARQSITVVRNDQNILPLHAEEPLRILHLVMSSDARNDAIQGIPEDELEARRIPTNTLHARPRGLAGDDAEDPGRGRPSTPTSWSRPSSRVIGVRRARPTCRASHARLLRPAAARGRPVVIVSFGSPYLLQQFPRRAGLRRAPTAPRSRASARRSPPSSANSLSAVSCRSPFPASTPTARAPIPRHEMTLRALRTRRRRLPRPTACAAVDRRGRRLRHGEGVPGRRCSPSGTGQRSSHLKRVRPPDLRRRRARRSRPTRSTTSPA